MYSFPRYSSYGELYLALRSFAISPYSVLQSSFSYVEMYGTSVDHPKVTSKAISLTQTSSVKKKSKPSKSKSVRSHASSNGHSLYSKQKNKKKKLSKSSLMNQTTHESTISTFSLAQESGLPLSHHSVTSPTKQHSLSILSSAVSTSTTSRQSGCHDNLRTKLSGDCKMSLHPHKDLEDKGKGADVAKTSTPLLNPSNMSTSDLILSLSKTNKDALKPSVGGESKVRWSRRIPNMNLTPHTQVHRPALGTDGTQGRFRRGGKVLSSTLEDIARGLGRLQYHNVIVMSGAGISTPSGIPDFRTPGTGIYDNLQQYKIPDPTSIFDITYFTHHPKAFLTLARELYPGKYRPSLTHLLVKLLQDKKVLLRNYTQNIDGLERMAGVQGGKLVEAHGSFATASCIKCKTKQNIGEVKAAIFENRIPRCKHKYCFGLVKPDIVFFGEDLPSRFHTLQLPDFAKCDLLIIMGTSLEVEPFASLASLPRGNVPRLLLNRELVGPFKHRPKRASMDIAVTGDLVECVRELVKCAGWESDMYRMENDICCGKGGGSGQEERQMESSTSSSSTSTHGGQGAVLVGTMSKMTLKDTTNQEALDHVIGNQGDSPPTKSGSSESGVNSSEESDSESGIKSSDSEGVKSSDDSDRGVKSSADSGVKSSDKGSSSDSYNELEWRVTCGVLSGSSAPFENQTLKKL